MTTSGHRYEVTSFLCLSELHHHDPPLLCVHDCACCHGGYHGAAISYCVGVLLHVRLSASSVPFAVFSRFCLGIVSPALSCAYWNIAYAYSSMLCILEYILEYGIYVFALCPSPMQTKVCIVFLKIILPCPALPCPVLPQNPLTEGQAAVTHCELPRLPVSSRPQ